MILRLGFILAFCFAFFSCKNTGESAQNVVAPAAEAQAAPQPTGKKKKIVFFGDSLTAAYGLPDASKGYVSLLQHRLDSLGLPYTAVNAGLSGETTAGGNDRVDWVLKQPLDIFVLELGGNDALRGIKTEESVKNLGSIITKVKAKYPEAKIVLAGMQAPPNMGPDYTTKFKAMYPMLAQEHGATLIPFFLENVGGVPALNQGDRIHPNEAGQLVLLDNVWEVLQPLL